MFHPWNKSLLANYLLSHVTTFSSGHLGEVSVRKWGIIAGAALLAGCAATGQEVAAPRAATGREVAALEDNTGSLPNGSRFTTENVMKVHSGMGSNEILKMFGAPKNVSQSVCGAAVGKPWTCTTWEYGERSYDWASFTFAGHSGSLVLNDFNVHTK
jgi:hypothetical protein